MMLSQKRPNEEDTSDSSDSDTDTSKQSKIPKMDTFSNEIDSDLDYVILPWEDETEIILRKSDQVTGFCSRWELIQEKLHESTPISNVQDLINAIRSYNVVFDSDGRQTKPPWKCIVLSQYFNQLNGYDREIFFQEQGVLSTIRNLALKLRKLMPRLKLLKTGVNSSVTLHQLQIASILANAFLCTFPKGKADCPSINFNTLFDCSSSSTVNYYLEKIKCIMHYFKRIHCKQPTGNLSFHRLIIPDHKFPRWDKTTTDLCSLKVDVQGRIEDQEGHLQMDFANRYVGGGVLGRGCVQEEIRFIICPELIAARLFTESLADNEALFVIGAERYCQYSGYSNTFQFAGDYEDLTPFDDDRHRKTYLIVLDALYFRHSSEQYRESKILRELKKAYVGFKPMGQNQSLPLATGNWGCGAFGGDPQLKTILQLMASSQARRNMLYLTFGNSVLKNQIDDLYRLLKERSVNIGMLYRIIRLYNRERRKNQTVFEFIKESVNEAEKKKFSYRSSFPPNMKPNTFSFDFEDEMSVMEEASRTKFQTERPKSMDTYYPELNIYFKALDREVQSNSNQVVQEELIPERNYQKRENITESRYQDELIPERNHEKRENVTESRHESILDTIWFENELESVKKKSLSKPDSNKMVVKDMNNSQSLFSSGDEGDLPAIGGCDNKQFKNHVPDTDYPRSEVDSIQSQTKIQGGSQMSVSGTEVQKSVQGRKLFQPKITDCFVKK